MVQQRMFKTIRSKETKFAVIQHPSQINGDNLSNVKPAGISGIKRGNL
jgi:hypothetical protein